tara:strand:+ start:1476 stop:1919 length:444 start_codon:yes stop_codon:yes gene_type:complete
MSIVYEARLPIADEFWFLKEAIEETHFLLRESVPAALKNSLHGMVAVDDQRVVGSVRLLGDGVKLVVVEDLMVHPEYQSRGIGTKLMDDLMQWIDENLPEKVYIGLFTRKELHEFYNRYSFLGPDEFLYGMCTKKRTGHIRLTRDES